MLFLVINSPEMSSCEILLSWKAILEDPSFGEAMTIVSVDFTVSPSTNLQSFWIAVDDKDVQLRNNFGSIPLDDSKSHCLVWWLMGNPGENMAIQGRVGSRVVVNIPPSAVPVGDIYGGGLQSFNI